MKFKLSALIELNELKNNVPDLSLKRYSSYYVGTIKGYSMKTPVEEVYPFLDMEDNIWLLITEDSHLWTLFQSEKCESNNNEKKNSGFKLDDIFGE